MQVAEDVPASTRTPDSIESRARSRLGAGVARFELAAVQLASAGRRVGGSRCLDALGTEKSPLPDEDAGRALVELVALVGGCRAQSASEMEAATLGRVLRPDPARVSSSWSVECYRIGDFAPHTLRDHTTPTRAIEALSDCGDREHVAARLIATSDGGLSWVALVRTGARISFQLLGRDTVLTRRGVEEPEWSNLFEEALAHWGRRLAHWHREQGRSGPFFVARCARQLSGERDDATGAPGEKAPERSGGAAGETAPERVGDAAAQTAPERDGDAGGTPTAAELFFEVAASLDRLEAKMERITRSLRRLEREVAGRTRSPREVASATRTPAGRAVPPRIDEAAPRGRSVTDDPWTEAR